MKDALSKEIVQYVCIQAVHQGALSNDEGEGNENGKKAKQQLAFVLRFFIYNVAETTYPLNALYPF